MPPIEDHPQRYATVNELHARPFPSLTVPCTAVLLAICMLLSLPWFIGRNETVGAAAAARDLPIYNVKRDDKCVSLTFDAAWGDVKVRRTSR